MLIVFTALLAGFIHVLSGPDHLTAIAPYATVGKGRAWRTGARWGLGHSAGVLGVGFLLLLLRDRLHVEMLSAWGERTVGVMLMAIGLWGLRRASALGHGQLAASGHAGHIHGRTAFGVGTIHGLAGSSHVLGIVPALLLPSAIAGAAYLLFFGLGTIAAMAVFAVAIGSIAAHPAVREARGQSLLVGIFSVLAIGVGAFWLISAFRIDPASSLAALARS